jgi:hypothetical protein
LRNFVPDAFNPTQKDTAAKRTPTILVHCRRRILRIPIASLVTFAQPLTAMLA